MSCLPHLPSWCDRKVLGDYFIYILNVTIMATLLKPSSGPYISFCINFAKAVISQSKFLGKYKWYSLKSKGMIHMQFRIAVPSGEKRRERRGREREREVCEKKGQEQMGWALQRCFGSLPGKPLVPEELFSTYCRKWPEFLQNFYGLAMDWLLMWFPRRGFLFFCLANLVSHTVIKLSKPKSGSLSH